MSLKSLFICISLTLSCPTFPHYCYFRLTTAPAPAVLQASALQVKFVKHPPTYVLIASQVTTAHQVKFVIQTTNATALVYPTIKIVQQTMEPLSMLVVLLAFAAILTRLVVVQVTVIVRQTKYAKHL